ncbi:putative diguanylate cyclase YegE [mine drainage metagenome]|uniref:Putative diguanylate cyclase YegE n=1 Tax=mine drainage metagenome TaxID=410659 RepID=A0A1J5QF37_9ZZZZ
MAAQHLLRDAIPDDNLIRLAPEALECLMPMFLWLSPSGHIRAVGATLRKLLGGADPTGLRFLEVFHIRRPRHASTMDDVMRLAGTRMHLQLRIRPQTGFRGIAVPLADGQGALVNLSFGIEVAEAVRAHDLTDADFAPTDLTVEMLYLAEAKSAVMTELHDLNRRLQLAKSEAEEQALTDTLTGLGNRRKMDTVIDRLILSGVAFGLMHVDLDFFKQVNDTLGHAAGDHVLQCVSRVLRAETRTGDTVARVGGDEFVLIFPGLAQTERLATIAERIIQTLAQPFYFEGKACRVSASIGMNVSTQYDPPQPDRMLSDADRALYASKYGGRSRATAYSPDLDLPDIVPAG